VTLSVTSLQAQLFHLVAQCAKSNTQMGRRFSLVVPANFQCRLDLLSRLLYVQFNMHACHAGHVDQCV
jgi:hypothetical protein